MLPWNCVIPFTVRLSQTGLCWLRVRATLRSRCSLKLSCEGLLALRWDIPVGKVGTEPLCGYSDHQITHKPAKSFRVLELSLMAGQGSRALGLAALGMWTMALPVKVAWELLSRTPGGHKCAQGEAGVPPELEPRGSGSPARIAERGQGYGSLTLTSPSELPDLDAQRSKPLLS